MKKTFCVILSLLSITVYAQSEATNWYFGYNAGINFNQGNNTVSSLNRGSLSTNEGCASISDDSGNLLFYTDGIYVWNKNHLPMTNGFGLLGDPSSTQSAIIVPKPNDPNIYYIFTVDDHGYLQGHFGLNYSEVDMTLDGGLGAITTKNVNLLRECTEKVTAVLKDCLTKSIWVVSFASENGNFNLYNTFHAFEVSTTGVSTSSVKSTFPLAIQDVRGYLKLSPDGTKLACANTNDGLYLYDFDVVSGMVTNQTGINIPGTNNVPYGVEFSPNSQFLYINASNDYFNRDNSQLNEIASNHSAKLIQYDFSEANIQNSAIVIDERQLYRGGLQLAPNGKIYRALSATYNRGLPYLGAINNPNEKGLASNYTNEAVNLSPNTSSQGLPPFIQSFFNTQIDIIKNGKSTSNLALCVNDSYRLAAENVPNATYIWTIDGNPLPEVDYDLEVFSSGHYEVYIDPNNGDCAIEGEAFVFFNDNPDAFDYTILQCDEDGTKDGLTIFKLNEAHDNLTGNASNRTTKYYLDAARTFEIDGNSYKNLSNPQTIYVEVINDETGCFSNSELTLAVSLTDSEDSFLNVCDDDGIEDGFHVFNLSEADTLIISGLPSGLTTVYYKTYEDALLEQNELGLSFTNTIPYSQTIYARVENANNCYGISNVVLTVFELPNINTEDLVYYCLNFFPKPIVLNAGVLADSPANHTYNWTTGESSYTIQINEPGTYNVTVTNANGCSKDRTVVVEASNIATFDLPPFKVTDVTQNNVITVFVSGEGVYEYALFDETNTIEIRPFQDSNTFDNLLPGLYTVRVKDIKNDCGTIKKNVSVIAFPRFFTPNNDGINDTWKIIGVSAMFQPNTKIQIFNRFGKLIKQLDPLGAGWDGLFNGTKLPADDYWFSVELQDGRIFKNHITLKY